jgi:hypothetical protein
MSSPCPYCPTPLHEPIVHYFTGASCSWCYCQRPECRRPRTILNPVQPDGFTLTRCQLCFHHVCDHFHSPTTQYFHCTHCKCVRTQHQLEIGA